MYINIENEFQMLLSLIVIKFRILYRDISE